VGVLQVCGGLGGRRRRLAVVLLCVLRLTCLIVWSWSSLCVSGVRGGSVGGHVG
jgi:hypothetical protein